MNKKDGRDIPIGLGMALAQNTEAMKYFAQLPIKQQQAIIDTTHSIRSKQEMQSFVNNNFKLS